MIVRRHRKPLASLFLGVWLFALFAGIASACLTDEAANTAQMSGMAMAMGQHDGNHAKPPGCEQFCKSDTPLLTKLQLVQDQPAGQPLLVASVDVLSMPLVARSAASAHRAHAPPDVPLLLRTLRLAL
jgi:hypothetical protein